MTGYTGRAYDDKGARVHCVMTGYTGRAYDDKGARIRCEQRAYTVLVSSERGFLRDLATASFIYIASYWWHLRSYHTLVSDYIPASGTTYHALLQRIYIFILRLLSEGCSCVYDMYKQI